MQAMNSHTRLQLKKLLLSSALAFAVGLGIAGTGIAAELLPLPKSAQPITMPKEGYILQKAGSNGYVVIANGYLSTFVVTDGGVVLIDAPPAISAAIQKAVASVTKLPVTHVIYSHDHFDHIGAVTDFKPKEIIAHAETATLLSVYPDPKRPAPTKVISGENGEMTIGGTKFEFIYPGPNHEAGNMIIYVPSDKLAVMTDMIMPGWAPWRGWGNADHIPGVLKAHDALLALDFDTYVSGHVYRTGTRDDVETSRAFWVDLWTSVGEGMGNTPYAASKDGNSWGDTSAWFEAVAQKVNAHLIEKWGKKLGGVDTQFTHDTIVAAIVSQWTDVANIPKELLTK